jgi:hypothetical protein
VKKGKEKSGEDEVGFLMDVNARKPSGLEV